MKFFSQKFLLYVLITKTNFLRYTVRKVTALLCGRDPYRLITVIASNTTTFLLFCSIHMRKRSNPPICLCIHMPRVQPLVDYINEQLQGVESTVSSYII